jgi:hypothetical protein
MGIEDLIKTIDSELLHLYETSQNKGNYKIFNFKSALENLGQLMLEEGYSQANALKASDYISVFNDLCRPLFELPHLHPKVVSCKYYELLKGVKLSEERIDIGITQSYSQYKESQLSKGDTFDHFFHIDINKWILNRLSFEEYIYKLLKKKRLNKAFSEGPTLNIAEQFFTVRLSKTQQNFLFEQLKSGGFIAEDSDYNSFCHVFGGNQKPEQFKQLEWLKTKQLLRELLLPLIHLFISFPELKRQVPHYFTQSGRPLQLARNKTIPSTDSDTLNAIIDKLATL